MSTNCGSTNFSPAKYDFKCLPVGGSYVDTITFVDSTGAALDITGDTFSMPVKDSDGNTVDTLTLGSGLTVTSENTLQILFTGDVTDEVRSLTYRLIWSIPATSEEAPILSGKIIIVSEETICSACGSGATLRIKVGGGTTIKIHSIIGGGGSGDSTESWLNSLTEYDSDDEAITDGLSVGDWYLTSANHVSVAGGIPKKLLA